VDEFEKYHFDLEGYLLVRGLLTKAEAAQLLAEAKILEAAALPRLSDPPSFVGKFNIEYRELVDLGSFAYENQSGGGRQIIVDDFLNASPAFNFLVAHEPTMKYVRSLATGPYRLTSSELRIRYKNNKTFSHMGGPIGARNRYGFSGTAGELENGRGFDLLVVRVLYALHDISIENGPLCVVPGSHKANFSSPYGEDPSQEPGMIGLPMKAGDAIFFTENLRHGGLPNALDTARRTIHLMIQPRWAASQSPAHYDGDVHVSEKAWHDYSDVQRALLPPPAASLGESGGQNVRAVNEELSRLRLENMRLKGELEDRQGRADQPARRRGPRWLSAVTK
jgi:hypothetical protein